MHIMIATDGVLDVEKTATLVSSMAKGTDANVTIYTVVEIPRGMLQDMRKAALDQPADASVEFRKEQADTPTPGRWIGDDTVVARYIESKVRERTSAIAEALRAAGVEANVVGEEGENAARAILAAVGNQNVDVLCIGTLGAGRFDGLLGSMSTKIARLATCPVLLVR